MNRRAAVFSSVLAFSLAFGGTSSVRADEPRITVRISGGIGWLMSDEWFRDLRDQDAAQRVETGGPDFATLEERYGFERILPEFSAEVLVRVAPRLRIGLGAGYLRQTWNFAGRFERRSLIPEARADYRVSRSYRATVVPLFLAAEFEFLKSPSTALCVTGAAGVDLLGMKHVYEREYSFFGPFDGEFKEVSERTTFDGGRSQSVDLRLGVLAERRLAPGLATFAAAEFRFSPVGEVYGPSARESVFKSNGTTIYDVREEVPRSSINPDRRFPLSGPVLRAGLAISF